MKGPGVISMLMLVTLAIFAYAEAPPRAGHRESASLFSRKATKTSCPLGSRYSSFYNECMHSWMQVSHN